MPAPAAIQGACVGGGIDMITACDMRYPTENAFFSIQEINIGMTADVGTLTMRYTRDHGIADGLEYIAN